MPKLIFGPVGFGGSNVQIDVKTVQYLLNCVPCSEGGPDPELVVDGIAGPLTVGAISRFQRAQFNWSDARVDPFGRTLTALQAYDPYPQIPLPSASGKKGGKRGGKLGGQPGGKIVPGKSAGPSHGGKGGGKGGGKF